MNTITRPPAATRWFYPLASTVLLVLTVWGFQWFYFHGKAYPGRDLASPIRSLLVTHGLAMSLWMVIAAVQPWLVAAHRRKLHMRLGKAGAVVALAVLVSGVMVAIESVRITPPQVVRFTFAPKPFLMVPLSAVAGFAVCVGLGIWQRRNPSWHRPLMLLGSLSAVSAALARITVLNGWYGGGALEKLLGAFVITTLLAILLWLVKCLIDRKVDRAFGIIAAGLVLWFAIGTQVARTDVWLTVADLLLGSG